MISWWFVLRYAQVKWPASLLWDAFRALTFIVEADHQALDASLRGQCIKMALTLLKMKPHDRANTQALHFLARLFQWSPSSYRQELGQAFLEAGGPETLVLFLKSEPHHRNMALMAMLLTIKYFSGHIAQPSHFGGESATDIRNQLERHATTELPTLCEDFPPDAGDNQVSMPELQNYFKATFGRLPQWGD
jgi:hypothetical protein